MFRRITLFFAALAISATALAIPAKPVKKTIRLSDGTSKEVTLRGDEHMHFYQSADGSAFTGDDVIGYQPVDLEAISQRWTDKVQARNDARLARRAARKAKWGAETNPVSGKKKGLVILVNYSDKKMTDKHNNEYFNNYFNQEGFKQDNHVGSVHDYFYDQSYGQFDLTFDVVGPYTVSKTLAYYGENNSEGNDKHAAELIIEACKLADKSGVDFSKYDWDGDGKVDQVYVIYAGYGEASDADSNTIWPHEFELSWSQTYYGDGSGAQKFDGVTVDTYACSCELAGNSGSRISGIGTACHEFSHCMCIPDLYDTAYGGSYGMAFFDLMDAGSYAGPNFDGEVPVGYTSYERMYCGWSTPIELDEGCDIKGMKSLGGTKTANGYEIPETYIIYNKRKPTEYYMLENRQTTDRWFQCGYAHGLLVLHVDFDKNTWANNAVNNTKDHQRLTIIGADNDYSGYWYSQSHCQGKTYPGNKKKTELTDTSTPAATLFNNNTDGRKFMGKPITEIAENTTDHTISFTFNGGHKIAVPADVSFTALSPNSFKASWTPVDEAASYDIQLQSSNSNDPADALLLQEDFSNCQNTNPFSNTDITSSMDKYTNTKGWTGSKLYTSNGMGLRIGSSTSAGKLVSPSFTPTESVITVAIMCTKYNTDNGTLKCAIDNGNSFTIKPAEEGKIYFQTLSVQAYKETHLTISTSTQRAYISYVAIYDAELTAEQMTNLTPAVNEMVREPLKVKETIMYNTDKTSYTFLNLSCEKTYKFQVRSVASDGKVSDWSDYISVQLPTDVEEIKTDASSTDAPSAIYDMSGRRVTTPRHGIYLINGRKVVK